MLLDDQPEMVEGGIIVQNKIGCTHMDYYVARVGTDEDCDFGQGDRVVLSDPNIGRRIMLDGVVYRFVHVKDIIAVLD